MLPKNPGVARSDFGNIAVGGVRRSRITPTDQAPVGVHRRFLLTIESAVVNIESRTLVRGNFESADPRIGWDWLDVSIGLNDNIRYQPPDVSPSTVTVEALQYQTNVLQDFKGKIRVNAETARVIFVSEPAPLLGA